MRRLLVVLLLTSASLVLATPAVAADKVTICHRSANVAAPYGPQPLVINTSDVPLHAADTGPVWDATMQFGWGDIIPPVPESEFPGLNWDEGGKAIYYNNCQPASLSFDPGPTASISGHVRVGATLTADEGTPSPTPDSYQYQWYADGAELFGATSKTYTLTAAEVGKTIVVQVTAVKTGYASASDTSDPMQPISTLPAKELHLETTSSTNAGKTVIAEVRKLGRNEPYTITIDDTVVKTGLADTKGKVKTKITVPLSLQPGKHTITVTGAVDDRTDSRTIKLKSPSSLSVHLSTGHPEVNKFFTVTVEHLLPGEGVEFYLDGAPTFAGPAFADSHGKAKVPSMLSTPGEHSIKAVGSYDGRSKTKTFTVK